MPSSFGIFSLAFCGGNSFVLWTMVDTCSGGDEAPWIPAGLAATVAVSRAVSP